MLNLTQNDFCPTNNMTFVPGCKYSLNYFLWFAQEVQSQLERICEMGQVMRKAVQVDDQHYCSVKERLAQLEVMCWTMPDSSL